jgi:hypothetical protein
MRQRNLDNAYSRYQFLKGHCEDPKHLPQSVVDSLPDQSRFAALTVKGRFEALSLNTLKAAAKVAMQKEAKHAGDGWRLLDGLREQLLGHVKRRQTSSRSKRAKAARQAAEVQTLEVRAREAELSNAARVRAYVDLFSKVGAMVRDPAMDELTRLRLRNLLQEHHQLYGGLMQPTDDKAIGLKVITGGRA